MKAENEKKRKIRIFKFMNKTRLMRDKDSIYPLTTLQQLIEQRLSGITETMGIQLNFTLCSCNLILYWINLIVN